MDMKSIINSGQGSDTTFVPSSPKSDQYSTSKSSSDFKDSKKKKIKVHCPLQLLKNYQREDLEKCFRTFDTKNDGKINLRDIKTMIRACGYEPTVDELRYITSKYDPQSEGVYSLGDFINIFLYKLTQKDKLEAMRAFKFFDRDQKGGINIQDIKNCAFELGENLHDEEIKEMITEADMNRDGIVSLQEFLKVVTRPDDGY